MYFLNWFRYFDIRSFHRTLCFLKRFKFSKLINNSKTYLNDPALPQTPTPLKIPSLILVTIPIRLIDLLHLPALHRIDIGSEDHLSEAVVVHPLQTGPLLSRVHVRTLVLVVYRGIQLRFQVRAGDLYLVLENFWLFYHIIINSNLQISIL